MSKTLMFVPLHPDEDERPLLHGEELAEELVRHGIALPSLDEGVNTYSLMLPDLDGERSIDEEVTIKVESDTVLWLSIEQAQADARRFWLLLIKLGYSMLYAGHPQLYVNAEIGAAYDDAGGEIDGFEGYQVVRQLRDLEKHKP